MPALITASMIILREKLGGGPVDHSAGLGVMSGALFLGSSKIHPMLLMTGERLPRTWIAHRKCMRGIRELV
jgi:hypothetical protein